MVCFLGCSGSRFPPGDPPDALVLRPFEIYCKKRVAFNGRKNRLSFQAFNVVSLFFLKDLAKYPVPGHTEGMETTITPKALSEASGCSLRSAYHYIGGTLPWPPEIAAVYERLTGVSRLHLLYPGEYDRAGQRTGGDDAA